MRLGQRGYTLIEMMVITSIVIVLTAMVIGNARVGDRRHTLQDSANLIVSAMRQAEAAAAGSQVVAGSHRRAYGACITDTSVPGGKCIQGTGDAVQVYARTLTDCSPSACTLGRPTNPDIIATYRLATNVQVGNGAGTYVDFQPPVPSMKLNGGTAKYAAGAFTVILTTDAGYIRNIIIEPVSGAAYVQ